MSRPRLALAGTLSAYTAGVLARTVKALAEPNRLQMVAVLHAEDRWMKTAELRAVVPALSEDTVLHHLYVLERAHVTRRTKDGGVALHRLQPGAVDGVVALLRGGR